jgi:hypothetical protein
MAANRAFLLRAELRRVRSRSSRKAKARRIEIVHSKFVRLQVTVALDETQQELERVAVGLDGARTQPALVDQVLAEVPLEDGPKQAVCAGGLHAVLGAECVKRSNFPPATARSSRVPVRYQYVSVTLP